VDAASIKKTLDENVIAQKYATTAIEQRLQICCADLNNKEKPMSSFLFVGSTGVGKTETAKQLSKILFDNDRSLIRMDMSEYALDESIDRFREEITQAVWTRPYSIILLDEIEKACAPVTKLLLQVLDDGRLIDRHNREVTFKNSYIIITTNAGSEIFKTIAQYAADDSGSGKLIASYETLIRKAIVEDTGGVKFPPELLGRIDCLVPFQPLSERTMEQICQIKLTALKNLVKQKHHCDVFISNDIYKYIIQDKMTTDSDAGGARAVVSRIEREVTTEIAKYLNEHRGVPRIYVNVCGDLAIENKTQLESRAYILITDRELTDQEIQATKTFRTGV
jgi:ATP-dependent Clp protease ATP-binding subunit ClpC